MSITRGALCASVLLCAGLQLATECAAQAYPAKVVRLIVPFTAGSGVDTAARIYATALGETFGQQVIVDNRGGAAGNIGMDAAARAPADGYTLVMVNSGHTANATLYRKLSYDLLRDFSPVTQLVTSPNMVLAHPSVPVKSVNDLVRLAKGKPGAVNYASAGTGAPTFLAMELLKKLAGIDIVHVPYRGGGEALTAVISGEVSIYFAPVAASLPYVRTGRVRALAVTSARRLSMLPEVATIAESIPAYELQVWYGVQVPVKTPKEIVNTVHAATVTALSKPDVSRRLTDLGYIPVLSRPDEFAAYIRSDIERVGKLIRELDLKAD